MAQRRLSLVLDLDTGRYSGRLAQAGTQLRSFGGTVDRTSKSVRQMSDGFDRMGGRMSTPLQKLRDYVIILGNMRLALLNVRDLAIGWVGALLNQSAKVERLTVLMKGLSKQTTEVGKNREAQSNLNELFDMARRTGFAVDDLADSFVKFQSAKLNPRDGSLQALADAVASFGGTSDTMHRASIAIQQMAGKGVVSMEELRQQLGEAVPNAMSLMARSMGKTVAQFSKEVATGTVKAGPALALMFAEMQRVYTGAGEKLSQTMTGQLAELRTNITAMSTSFTGLDRGDGLFATSVGSLKELNQLLQGQEGRQMVMALGNAVNSVASALVGAVRVAVEFKSVVGAALQTIAFGVAALTAKRFGAWVLSGAQEAIAGVRALAAQFRAAGIEMAAYRQVLAGNVTSQNVWAIQNNAAAMQLQQVKARIAAEQTLIGVTRQSAANARVTITNLSQEIGSYRQLVPQIQAQVRERQAQLRTAQTLHAANLSIGRSSVASAQAVAQAEANLTRETTLLTRTRVMLRQATGQLTVAEAELAAAQNAEFLATERLTIAEAQNTLGKRAMAVAGTLAAGATRALQGAMSLLLNPVVMIGVALFQAASAAGFFETKADRAAAAADRLRQGLGSLADMEAAVERRRQIRKEIADNQDVNPLLGVSVIKDGWNSGLNTRNNAQRAAERARLEKEDASLAGTIRGARGPLAMQQATANWQSITDRRSQVLNRAGVRYGQDMDQLQSALDRGDKTAVARMQARTKQFDQAKLAVDKGIYNTVLGDYNRAKAAGKPADELDALAARVLNARDQLQQTQQGITTTSNQMTAALGDGAKGLDKWGRAAVSADGVAAAAAAKMAGHGAAIAKFNAELAGGKFAGASEEQVARMRRAAVATDALAASRKAASADNGFESRMTSMAGRLAEIQDSLQGGNGELAKFNAQLKASGDNLGLTPAQVKTLRDLAQALDEAEHSRDVKKSMDDLNEAFNKARTEGDELWGSFARGTMEADQRLAQIKARFADKLVGLSGQELANAEAKIRGIVDQLNRADAAELSQRWRDSADEMRNALLDENAQREANFQRELLRQQILLDAIRNNAALSSQEKQRAEEGFLSWKRAAEARDQRASEGQLVQQARQWANLGQNIQASMSQALGSIVDGMLDANANMADLIVGIIKQLMKVILTAMIAYALLSAVGMTNNASGQHVSMGSFLKGQLAGGMSMGGRADPSSTIGYGASGASNLSSGRGNIGWETAAPTALGMSGVKVPTKHTGGVIGGAGMFAHVPSSVFSDAKTYHGGGWIGGRQLKPGEVPMIGLDDEVVLTKEQQRLLGRSGGLGATPNVQVNVINNSGTELETEHGEPEFNGKDMIVNVVVEAVQKQGRLRDVISQVGQR